MWSNNRSSFSTSRPKTSTSRTFQEVLEQQAARQAGWSYDDIPLQTRHSHPYSHSRPTIAGSSDTVDVYPYHLPNRSGVTIRTSHSDTREREREQQDIPPVPTLPTSYPQPSVPRTSLLGQAGSSTHLPPSSSFDYSSTSGSSTSYLISTGTTADTSSTYASYPSSSTSASFHTHPLSPTTLSLQTPWDADDWGHPDCLSPQPSRIGQTEVVKAKGGGFKAWLKHKTKSDKAKGKEVAPSVMSSESTRAGAGKEAETRVKAEKPVFAGGGRGGAQNRRVKPKPPVPAKGLTRRPSLFAISETPLTSHAHATDLNPHPAPKHSSTTPLVSFTPDVQEALETLAPKPKFVGGGRGGMQNRKPKEVLKPSGASGSDGASSKKSFWTGSSGPREGSIVSASASTGDPGSSVHSGTTDGAGARFVGGGRGGVQNRKPIQEAVQKKKSQAAGGSDLIAGIGVSSYTVTSSQRAGSVRYSVDGQALGLGLERFDTGNSGGSGG